MKRYKYYSIITGLFVACLIISNILDTKIFMLFGLAFPTGIILFPIAYLFGDFLTEVYGYAASRKVIWTGFFSLLMMVISIKVAEYVTPAPFWEHQEDFVNILGKIPRIALASVTAFFTGEFANSFTLAKLKIRLKGKSMGWRFIASTFVGQAVDTTVFVSIAFIGILPLESIPTIILSAWIFKVLWEVIALPVSIPLVKWLKKEEEEDYYDNNTDFTPFKIN